MIYESRKELYDGQRVWGCGYQLDNYGGRALFCKPVLGIVTTGRFNSGYRSNTVQWFTPIGANERLQTSKTVSIGARKYADTYEECVELYNLLVRNEIARFQEVVDESSKDIIEVEEK